jgi:hypothetical protein
MSQSGMRSWWHRLRSHDLEDEASGELCCAAAAHRHAGRGWLGWGAGLRVRPAGRKIAGVQGVVEAVGYNSFFSFSFV